MYFFFFFAIYIGEHFLSVVDFVQKLRLVFLEISNFIFFFFLLQRGYFSLFLKIFSDIREKLLKNWTKTVKCVVNDLNIRPLHVGNI